MVKKKRKKAMFLNTGHNTNRPNIFVSFTDTSLTTDASNWFACKTIYRNQSSVAGVLWNKAVFLPVLHLVVNTC